MSDVPTFILRVDQSKIIYEFFSKFVELEICVVAFSKKQGAMRQKVSKNVFKVLYKYFF